jgi:hypothetical protein
MAQKTWSDYTPLFLYRTPRSRARSIAQNLLSSVCSRRVNVWSGTEPEMSEADRHALVERNGVLARAVARLEGLAQKHVRVAATSRIPDDIW